MKVLVVSAHPDDEILGVGGTILRHKEQGDDVYVCIVTKAYEPDWKKEYIEGKRKEADMVDRLMGIKKRYWCDFPTVRLNTIPSGEFNKKIADVINDVDPDVVYTHFEYDINEDHGKVFTAVMIATRPVGKKKRRVLCFETMSSTEWNNKAFIPNVYVDISKHIEKKVRAFSCYASEVRQPPHPRSLEGVRVWAKKRGYEICTEYAEAFMLVREVWQ